VSSRRDGRVGEVLACPMAAPMTETPAEETRAMGMVHSTDVLVQPG